VTPQTALGDQSAAVSGLGETNRKEHGRGKEKRQTYLAWPASLSAGNHENLINYHSPLLLGQIEKKILGDLQAYNVVCHVDIKDRQQQSALAFSAHRYFN
jgi:hypothetical protein